MESSTSGLRVIVFLALAGLMLVGAWIMHSTNTKLDQLLAATAGNFQQDRIRQCLNGGGNFQRTPAGDESCVYNGAGLLWQNKEGYFNWFPAAK